MINLSYAEGIKRIKEISKRKLWLKALVEDSKVWEAKLGQVNYTFMSDEDLRKVNVEFLNHDTYTDIITFDYVEESNGMKKINGEIYISMDRINENALKFNVDVEIELNRVMAHGMLHLIGFKDKKPADKAEMTKQEDLALKLYKRI